ncbi:MAG: aspartate aminotransferase family protein, partial [Pseudomonadota bacterium]
DGVEAIQARLRRDLENAQWFKQQVEATPEWEVLAPVALQTVCIRHVPTEASGEPVAGDALDQHTLRWVQQINDSGAAFLSPSVLDDRWMVRVSIGVEHTEREHVANLWTLLQEAVTAS